MKSIIQSNYDECFNETCRCTVCLEEHHIFGNANRKLSEKYGLKVRLCHWCHNEPPCGVHHNREEMDRLHRIGQEAFERVHGTREEFMKIFGRNYL